MSSFIAGIEKCREGRAKGWFWCLCSYIFAVAKTREQRWSGPSQSANDALISTSFLGLTLFFLQRPAHPQEQWPSVYPNTTCSNPLCSLNFITLQNQPLSTWPICFWSFPLDNGGKLGGVQIDSTAEWNTSVLGETEDTAISEKQQWKKKIRLLVYVTLVNSCKLSVLLKIAKKLVVNAFACIKWM